MKLKLSLFFFAFSLFAFGTFAQEALEGQPVAGAGFDFMLIVYAVLALSWLLSIVFIVLSVRNAKNRFEWKAFWIVFAVLFGPWGALLYFLLGLKKRVPSDFEAGRGVEIKKPSSGLKVTAYSDHPLSGKVSAPQISEKTIPSSFSKAGYSRFSSASPDYFEAQKKKDIEYKKAKDSSDEILGKFKEFHEAEQERQEFLLKLSEEEKAEARELVRLLASDKNKYTREDVLAVILEKGYSLNVARKVVNDLYL